MYYQEHLISNITTNTYKRELERYGSTTIESFETLFWLNSVLIIDIIKLTNEDEKRRWLYGMKGIDVFLDGNTSINAKAQDFSKSYIPISFLGQNIFVKNGVGKLAAILKAIIIPSISHRDENEENTIEFFEEISISDFSNKQEFSVKSVEKCYSQLEPLVAKHPMQWECWSYIHNWFYRNIQVPYEPTNKDIVSKFNTQRYDLYEVNGTHFIFDLFTYQSYPIPTELGESLEKNILKKINKDFLNALKSKNILV